MLAALAALVLFAAPAAMLALVMRRSLLTVVLGPATTVAALGVVGVAAHEVGAAFDWPVAVLPALLIAALIGALFRRERAPRTRAGSARPSAGTDRRIGIRPFIAASLLSAVVFAALVTTAIGPLTHFSQTYDGVFHLNAIAYVLDTGDASSFDLYRVSHPAPGVQFYPAAWHALVAAVVQLSGASIPVATNVTWIVAMLVCFLPGVVYLADVVAPSHVDRRVLLPVAALAATAFAPFPYLLLSWGTLYPNALAYALLPTGVGLAASFVLRREQLRNLLAPFAVWLVASVFAHPRSLISWAAIVFPLAVVFVIDRLRPLFRDRATRGRALGWTIAIAAAAVLAVAVVSFAVLRYFDAAARPISDRLNGGPALARYPLWQALLQGLTLTTPAPPSQQTVVPEVLLVVLLAVGVVLALRTRGLRWLAAAFLLIVALYALAAGSDSDFAKIATGFWYKDKYRLMAVLPTLAVPLVAIAASEAVAAARGRLLRLAVGIAVGLALISGWATIVTGGMSASIRTTFALPAHEKGGLLLDADEYRLLSRLDTLVPAGQLVLGDPWNGSAMSGVLSHRQAVFPHLTGDWGTDRTLVATALDQAATDPAVCQALDRLDAHYVVADPELLYGGDPAQAFFTGIDRAVGTTVLTPVARDGSAVLYWISACARQTGAANGGG